MFVILQGHVTVSQRDGFGRSRPIVTQGRGQFIAEVGQLSGRRSFVDGHADDDVGALLVPASQLRALLIAEADLGERILRALILRRMGLVQSNFAGPVVIGHDYVADVALLRTFLERNGYPHHVIDPNDDEAWGLAVDGSGHAHRPAGRYVGGNGRRRRGGRRSGGAGDGRLLSIGRHAGRSFGLPIVRRAGGGKRAHRELPRLSDRYIGSGARGTRVRAGAEVRRRNRDTRASNRAGA